MILVDIEVPANGQTYDFRLDENAYIADLVDEIGTMLVLNGDGNTSEDIQDMLLCDCLRKRILPLDATLKLCGIGSGDRLFFI